MSHATFTRTTVPPNQLIQSVCNQCSRKIAISRRTDLVRSVEAVHVCIIHKPSLQLEKTRPEEGEKACC